MQATIKPHTSASLLGSISRQSVIAVFVLVGALALATVMAQTDADLAPLWFLGIGAGFTLQRSRFCFTAAFRDLFLFGEGRVMKGVLTGMAVATLGFAIIMYGKVPFPRFGAVPSEAHILPVGLSAIVGGLLFGFGMVLAGGCVSGSLYRVAEGYIGSWVSTGGIIIGLGLLSQTWNGWWNLLISHEPKIWLAATVNLGYGGGVALTLAGLFAAFLLVLWWESRAGVVVPNMSKQEEPENTFREKLQALWRKVFVRGWPAVVGGAILGFINILMYMVHMPWGVTGELSRWSNALMGAAGVAPPVLLGLNDIGGCAARASEGGFFTHTFAVTVSLLVGAFVGALLAGEFKLRFPPSPRRYVQSLGGGIIMGYGAGLAIGCTIGAFFSAIPSLSISGWLFALALAGGAFAGTKAITRLA